MNKTPRILFGRWREVRLSALAMLSNGRAGGIVRTALKRKNEQLEVLRAEGAEGGGNGLEGGTDGTEGGADRIEGGADEIKERYPILAMGVGESKSL